MSKIFYTVDSGFTGILNLAGHGRAYVAGDTIVLDNDSLEQRAVRDLGVHALSNHAAQGTAFAALVTSGDLAYGGEVSDVSKDNRATWTKLLTLSGVADGEIARFKPGFAGRVSGSLFQATADATTAAKTSTLTFTIEGTDLSDEIHTATVTGSPAGGSFALTIQGVLCAGIAYNASTSAFQAIVDATSLATKIVIGGSAGAYTITAAGALLGTDLTVVLTTNGLTGGTSPTVAFATTVAGGSARIVGASGNPATLGLTSAAVTDGGVIAGETIATGTNANHGNFGANDEIVVTASATTAFVEGAGVLAISLLAV